MRSKREYPIGAEIIHGEGVDFRVWAPRSRTAEVEFVSDPPVAPVPLRSEGNGYFSGTVAEARAGMRYRIRVERGSFPDPGPAAGLGRGASPLRGERRL